MATFSRLSKQVHSRAQRAGMLEFEGRSRLKVRWEANASMPPPDAISPVACCSQDEATRQKKPTRRPTHSDLRPSPRRRGNTAKGVMCPLGQLASPLGRAISSPLASKYARSPTFAIQTRRPAIPPAETQKNDAYLL